MWAVRRFPPATQSPLGDEAWDAIWSRGCRGRQAMSQWGKFQPRTHAAIRLCGPTMMCMSLRGLIPDELAKGLSVFSTQSPRQAVLAGVSDTRGSLRKWWIKCHGVLSIDYVAHTDGRRCGHRYDLRFWMLISPTPPKRALAVNHQLAAVPFPIAFYAGKPISDGNSHSPLPKCAPCRRPRWR
jgi:hypothetical protein